MEDRVMLKKNYYYFFITVGITKMLPYSPGEDIM